jgi:tRNA pseudouridine55 synthase
LSSATLDGVLVVDKPAGPTSHDVVDRVRRAFGTRRVGHTGTLDPFATGVLPVCVGKATRLARFLGGGEKVYRATARLGFATTTDDAEGEPLHDPRPVTAELADVARAAARFVGEIDQVPPLYSAKRIEGRRSYDLARRGQDAPRRPSRVSVYAFDVLVCDGERVEFEVRCSTGTYVRALARDLGAALGVGAHLTALRRTRSGVFGLEDAVTWDDLDAGATGRLVPLSGLLLDWPSVSVGAEGRSALRHGRALTRRHVPHGFPDAPAERLRAVDAESGALLAVVTPRGFGPPAPGLSLEPCLQPEIVLCDDPGQGLHGPGRVIH